MSRTTILIVVLVLIVGGIAFLLRQPEPLQEALTLAQQISATGYREDGNLAWTLQAQSGSLDTNDSSLEDVKLTLHREPDASIVVIGDHLSRNSAGSTLTGAIRVEQEDGLSLDTDTLYWDERNDVLESGSVTIEMDRASIEAGSFHHDLNTEITTLSHGIEARLTSDDVNYVANSDSGEATSDQLILLGNISIQAEEGSSYACQRLESDRLPSSIRLIGDVVGQWQKNAFAAETVILNDEGIRMHENVIIDLDLLRGDESHDS